MTLQWRRMARHSLIAGPWLVKPHLRRGWYGIWRDGACVEMFNSRTDALNEAERRHAAESVPIVEVLDC